MSANLWKRALWSGMAVAGTIAAATAAAASPSTLYDGLAPRPVAAAERAALEIALEFARRGPEAIWERLAPDSPLRLRGREAALAEIGARLGPREGATWELQTASRGATEVFFGIRFPSGQEEIAAFELTAGERPQLASLRTLLDPARAAEPLVGAGVEPEPFSGRAAGAAAPAAAAALALAFTLLCCAWLRQLRAPLRTLALALAALGCQGSRTPERVGSAPYRPAEVGALQDLRRAFALGGPDTRPLREASSSLGSAQLDRIRELWRAELALLEGNLAEARRRLGEPRSDDPPLADRLLARLAKIELDGAGAVARYDRLRAAGFEGDALILEQRYAEAYAASAGRGGESVKIQGLLAIGSRLAEPWYEAARGAALDGDAESGEALLRIAWAHRPLPRQEIFDDSVLAWLAARASLFPLFEPGSPDEPKVEAVAGEGAAPLSGATSALRCGSHLRLRSGPGESWTLEVPGGAALAPAGARLIDALELRRIDEAQAVRESRLLLAASSGAALELTPRLLRWVEVALPALLEQRQWVEVEKLSAPLVGSLARLAPGVVGARAAALSKLGRGAEAESLLLAFAKLQLDAKRPAPGTLYELANLLSKRGDYASAIRLVRKADAQIRLPLGERRLRIFQMAQDLAADSGTHRTEHFEIRYPRGTGAIYPRDLGQVLEIERTRLLQHLPKVRGERIEVELFPLEQFLQAYGGEVAVIGVFDGRLRVPLADVRTLHPAVVALVSHELMHALLAQASGDGAPHWFQEGLAQWIEGGSVHVNPYPDLERSGHTIAFPLLESILQGFAEASLVELAYNESLWSVAFLESRYGDRGLKALAGSFAAGASTEEAIASLTGWSLAEFDRELRRWATQGAPAQRRLEARRFDQMEGSVFERGTRAERAETGPLVGSSAPKPRAVSPGTPSPEMDRWYLGYRSATAEVRAAYAPILASYTQGRGTPPPDQCRRLSLAVQNLTRETAVLAAPDRGVEAALRKLYRAIGDVAFACMAERSEAALESFERVGPALDEAAQRMKPYGEAP